LWTPPPPCYIFSNWFQNYFVMIVVQVTQSYALIYFYLCAT
jgi:hypothetical protein